MAHEPIQFGSGGKGAADDTPAVPETDARPLSLDLDRDTALTVRWSDGVVSVYPVALLRRMSPSAEAKAWRAEQQSNPLAVLPDKLAGHHGPVAAKSAELVGRYALRITFTDGHSSGLFSWDYLRALDPAGQAGNGPEA